MAVARRRKREGRVGGRRDSVGGEEARDGGGKIRLFRGGVALERTGSSNGSKKSIFFLVFYSRKQCSRACTSNVECVKEESEILSRFF